MNFKMCVAVVAVITATGSLSFAAKKPKYSPEFDGKFRGTYVATVDTATAVGPVSAKVDVPKNGRKMKVTLSGIVVANGTSFPVACTLRFDSRGRVRSNALLMGLIAPITTSNSRAKGKNGNFDLLLKAAPGAIVQGQPITGQVDYRLRFSEGSLKITGSGVVDSGTAVTYTVRYNAN